ncbi:sugar MFS transporter [Alteromonas pelagimontana]|uniref:Sugar MFS transporter n=2 Tax=Alteromonas pelagimontana TaxID=1858656 RepID=A0A6M4MIJ3_9ALTE|nr:sugar MFS transporter [Alteromonas pelagimontana]
MTIIGILFFIFGFVTWLNGSLIPFLQIICELDEFEALLVTFSFYIAYTVMAYPMSMILSRSGYKNGMAIGLLIMSVGALLHIPAALSGIYSLFLLALFVLATGLTILQTASNPYLVYLGPEKSAAMRISIMGIVNKGAGVVVPIIFTALILSDIGDISKSYVMSLSDEQFLIYKETLSQKLIMPYTIMAGVLFVLIGLLKFAPLPEIQPTSDPSGSIATAEKKSSILNYPQAVLGAFALFAYVGVEVIAGDTIGLYGASLDVPNFSGLTSYTMFFMVIGYVLGIICIPRFISQQKALTLSAVAGSACIVGIITASPDSVSLSQLLWGWTGIPVLPNPVTWVALMGLAHALVWPSVWPLALKDLGQHSAQGSALLIMGISGGAILPLVFGKISSATGDLQLAYLVGLPCYLFILFYALRGHKIRRWPWSASTSSMGKR